MTNSEVDFDSYRKEYESEDHWNLRKAFLIHFWNDFDKDMVERNAQLFVNIEMLGSTYHPEIMKLISELANQVPEIRAYRKLKKNKLKRTLVGAQFSIQSKYSKLNPPEPPKESIPAKVEVTNVEDNANNVDWVDEEKRDWDWENRKKNQNYHLLKLDDFQKNEGMKTLLKDVVVFDDMNGVIDFNKTNGVFSKLGKFESTYDDSDGQFLYIFNSFIIGEGKGDNKKQAKKNADRSLETNLRMFCYSIRPKLAFFSGEDIIQRDSGNCGNNPTPDKSDQLKEDNLGYRMLKSLGWKGGTSLGPKNQGIIDPVNLSIKIGRKGLGNDNPNFDANYFRNLLKNFKNNHVEYDLIFSPDFAKEERAQIHQ